MKNRIDANQNEYQKQKELLFSGILKPKLIEK